MYSYFLLTLAHISQGKRSHRDLLVQPKLAGRACLISGDCRESAKDGASYSICLVPRLTALAQFDDGWAVGSIVGGPGSGKSEGAFPLVVCVCPHLSDSRAVLTSLSEQTAVGSEAADNFTTSSASAYSREGGPAPVTSRPPSMRNGRTSSRSDRERSDRESYISAATQYVSTITLSFRRTDEGLAGHGNNNRLLILGV